MSKKRGGGDFNNLAAQRFRNIAKVPLMKQSEIESILEKDIDTILWQVTCARKGLPYPDKNGKRIQMPDYIANAFANLSTSLWFLEFVKDNVVTKKDHIRTRLTKDQVDSLMDILADVYSKSMGSMYTGQAQELEDRNAYISKAFIRLNPRLYHMTRKLTGLTVEGRRDLTIQVYGNPVFKFKYIHRKINDSTASDKTKLKFLKMAYGKRRYVQAVGAAMTTEGNGSDCLAMIFDDMMSVKKKKRGPYLQAYAEAYKRNGPSRYFRMDRNFYEKNHKLIKYLIGTKKHPEWAVDIGYRKAFKDMKKGKAPEPRRQRDNNRDNRKRP